jgi:hypothetical protein
MAETFEAYRTRAILAMRSPSVYNKRLHRNSIGVCAMSLSRG